MNLKEDELEKWLRDYVTGGDIEGQVVERSFADERQKADALDLLGGFSESMSKLGTLGGVAPKSSVRPTTDRMKQNIKQYLDRKDYQKSSIAPSVLSYLARTKEDKIPQEEKDLMKARAGKLRAETDVLRDPKQNPKSILDMLRLQRLGQQIKLGELQLETQEGRLNPQTTPQKWDKLGGEQKVKASLLSNVVRDALKAKDELDKIKGQEPETMAGRLVGAVAPMYKQTKAYQGGSSTPFMNARSNVIDALGKFRSGAALNASEEKRYAGFTPSMFDTPERAEEMLDRLIRTASADLMGYGLSIQDVMDYKQEADKKVDEFYQSRGETEVKPTISKDKARAAFDKFKDRLDELSPENRAKLLDAFTYYGFEGFERR